MTRLMNRNEDVLNKLRPGIIEDYQNLKDKIKEQKDENEQLLKHLLGLKKEAAST
jgi:cell division septum initiation protein DivIVA